jgi:hypothetical protein
VPALLVMIPVETLEAVIAALTAAPRWGG